MSVSGLTATPSRCCLRVPVCGMRSLRRVSAFPSSGKLKENIKLPHLERCYWADSSQGCKKQHTFLIKSAMDASYGGDMSNGSSAIFPRINVRDPYKRLGISKEASEDEIQGARNFLVQKYAGHKPSVDAIESAHDKIIMQQFYERKNPKIDLKKKFRKVSQSRVMQVVTNRFQTPSTKIMIKTAIAFAVLGVLTVLFPTEGGPTVQVIISLIATIYFIHERLKSKVRAFLYGAGAFIVSWVLATFLMASVIPPLPILKGRMGFEAKSTLITYVLLWISSTYLK